MLEFSRGMNKKLLKYSLRNIRMQNTANENVQCAGSRYLFYNPYIH